VAGDPTTGLDVGAVLDIVSPSVISIEVGDEVGQGQFATSGAGSGFIISADGLAITNAHVAFGNGPAIRVRMFDGEVLPATLVGASTADDLALIQIEGAAQLIPATLGDSDALRVGDDVVAIGNALALGEEPTVTRGIVSAKNRVLPEASGAVIDGVIQTDAAINPGNSGGPLVDARGAVVGVNTAIIASGQNVGFSIPSNTVKALLPQLQEGNGGEITPRRTFLGVSTAAIDELDPQALAQLNISGDRGAVVTRVEPGSAAAEAGLLEGDVIVAIDDDEVDSPSELRQRIRSSEPGDSVVLRVMRAGAEQELTAVLGQS
jgi:putative serine protease PepD